MGPVLCEERCVEQGIELVYRAYGLLVHAAVVLAGRIGKPVCAPALFVALFVPLTALQALPAPGGQNPFFYFFIYATGFLACMDSKFADMLAKSRLHALLALLVTVPAWLWMMEHFHGAADFSAINILLTLLRTLNVWLTLIVIMGYGSKLLNFRHPWLDYANEAAFPIYIIGVLH